jgi:hypothetical protein
LYWRPMQHAPTANWEYHIPGFVNEQRKEIPKGSSLKVIGALILLYTRCPC